MKINEILHESGQGIAFNDLEPMHVFALKAIASGQWSADDVVELMYPMGSPNKRNQAVSDLKSFKLLTDDGELNGNGIKFGQYAVKHGSLEKRNAVSRNAKGSINRGEKGPRERNGDLRRADNARGFNG